jgi:hypothetical protein
MSLATAANFLQPPPPAVKYEDRLLDRPTTADWLGVHCDTLTNWAREERGPTVTYVGRGRVRYRVGDVLDYLNSGRKKKDQAVSA